MARKKVRKRQNDPQDDSGSSEDDIDVKKCTHLAKGINLPGLKKIPDDFDLVTCEECPVESSTNEEKPVSTEVVEGKDDEEEKKEKEILVCLQCGHRGCGRSDGQHAIHHWKTPHSDSHDLVVSSVSWMTWCYKCDDWVTVESNRLQQAIETIRKKAGLTGKPKQQLPGQMKRSQSHFDTVNRSASSGTLLTEAKSVREPPKARDASDVLQTLPPVKGLVNLGNTCFFNSVMQVLSQTHWLTQLLDLECREGKVMHLSGCQASLARSCASSCSTLNCSEPDTSDSGVGSLDRDSPELSAAVDAVDVILGSSKALTLTLASFVKEMHCPAPTVGHKNKKNNWTVTPSSLFNQVTKKNAQFRGFQQQDAHELLRHLLDGVRTEEITRRRQAILQHFHITTKPGCSSQQPDVDPVMRRKLKIYGKESAHTFVDQLFGGYLLSTVICESCHQPYQILEPFMDLSLPVSEEKSPPSGSYKRAGSKSSTSCFSPPPATPIIQSKHQRKKERARKGKGKSNKSSGPAGSGESCEDPATSPVEESTAQTDGLVTSADGATPEGQTGYQGQGPSATVESLDEADASVLVAGSHPSMEEDDDAEDEELSESADVEDNDDTNDKDIEEMTRKMKELSVQAEDMLRRHSDGRDDKFDATTLRKMRSEWISRSLCSLAVRYQASNHECSVMSCLNLFTAPELLTGSNKYGCDNCTRRKAAAAAAAAETGEEEEMPKTVYSVASKQLLIFAPPALLTLHLKRFTQNGLTLKKVNRHVEFPMLLDLAPFCSAAAAGIGSIGGEQKRVMYSLYGVIEHSGRLNGGHYTACVKVRPVVSDSLTKFLQRLALQTDDLERLRDQVVAERMANGGEDVAPADDRLPASDGVWYHVSDAHVMPVSEERVLRSQAFLLFYERIV